jgi:hypothetical protein
VADRPPEAEALVCCHTRAALGEGGDWEGVREGKGRPRRRFEKDLVRDAAVFVFMTATLAYVLHEGVSSRI